MTRPKANEAAPYYSRYIDLISSDDIVSTLKSQLDETKSFLTNISEEQSLNSYAPGKWTIRQVLNHVNDGERVFATGRSGSLVAFRMRCLLSDQDVCVEAAGANDVSWNDLTNEFNNVRQSTISLFENLPAEAWMRTGIASGYPFTVNALSYIIAGHVTHHRNVIQERYL